MRKFTFVDHTADLGVMVYGRSPSELFQHAAEAFFRILTEPRRIREKELRQICLEADGLEELLVAWLNEFLFLFDARGLLFRRFEIDRLEAHRLQATGRGERYEEQRHPIKTLIKAVTYHQLRIQCDEGIWKAQIIFDL